MTTKERKLYALTTTDDVAKEKLYIQRQGNILDFFTYFNGFSLGKWVKYTTIQTVTLKLHLKGNWNINWQTADTTSVHFLLEEHCTGDYCRSIEVNKVNERILGFTLTPVSADAAYLGGAWYGTFGNWQEKTIGISITTFKREEYITRNMSLLKDYQKNNPWLYVLVVDNGNTLPRERTKNFSLIHNPNYGGSGGFTRGMLEYVSEGNVDYVLLMDDDIVLDTTVLERTHSVLCGLKDVYRESVLSGAMLNLESPTHQYENTAHWGKIRLYGFGKGFNLTSKEKLVENEQFLQERNRYGAWWYCCIPVSRIKEIGYPLPVFVKGDDIEYGIRNDRKLIHMNGIGVWHQSFAAKISPVVNYYSDRNMLIINNYVKNCGFFTFCMAVFGRFVKRLLQGNLIGLYYLELALRDYDSGLTGITSRPADKKMQEINDLINHFNYSADRRILLTLPIQILRVILHYDQSHKDYLTFREEQLSNAHFWRHFLHLED